MPLYGKDASIDLRRAVDHNERLAHQNRIDFTSPEGICKSYGNGFVGSICDAQERDKLDSSGLCPVFEDVASHLQLDYSGQNALLYAFVLKLDPQAFTERQTTGDCFVAGTMVRMGDGSEKPIEEVRAGEIVISADNRRQRVLRTIRKPYSGSILDIHCDGYSQSVSCTPDHRFVTMPDLWPKKTKSKESRWERRTERREWKPAVALEEGQFLLLPHCSPEKESSDREYDLLSIMPVGTSTRHKYQSHALIEYGLAVQVSRVDVRKVVDGEVFCLEVENDHSFVANGYAVHNCVSHGTRNAVDAARAVEILLKGEPEEWVARGATEGIYGCRGHGGQGMSCDVATRFVVSNGGILLRQKYPELNLDLSVYNAAIGTRWGSSGVPANVVAEGKKHQAVYSSRITTVEGVIAALHNGYGVHCCSGLGFSNQRDESGFASVSGSWAHDMACLGHAVEGLSEEGFLIQNSWGPWNSGPMRLGQPPGSFWVRRKVMAQLVAAGGTFAVGNVNGWPARALPNWGNVIPPTWN